jgi:GTP-binding protein
MFLDRVKIWVRAGDGGDGAATFRQEAHVPRGGPDGGDGGRGGSVHLRVDAGQTTLRDFNHRHHFRATPGGRGTRARRHGKAGDDLILDVPPGTAVYDDETGALVADLVALGQTAMVARGGRGGLGNTHFKSSTHQAPKHAQKGEPGAEGWLRLELRLIADIGLVGLPNAGKSTILGAVTAATPKIADYPFTTLEPNLGVMDLGDEDERRPTIADVPGLIEGASSGAGLGHAFLRHVERTRILRDCVELCGDEWAGVSAEIGDAHLAQTLLRRRGFYRGVSDGIFSPNLEFSIRAFQSRLGIAPNGRLDMETLAALGLLPGQNGRTFMEMPRRRVVPAEEPPVRGEWIH